jgi:hypothetical protein
MIGKKKTRGKEREGERRRKRKMSKLAVAQKSDVASPVSTKLPTIETKKVTWSQLFRFSDKTDVALYCVAFLFAVANGAVFPRYAGEEGLVLFNALSDSFLTAFPHIRMPLPRCSALPGSWLDSLMVWLYQN